MNLYKMMSCVLFLYLMQKVAAEKTHFSRRIRTNEDGDRTVFVFETVLKKGLDQCIQTCKEKEKCKFINYHVQAHACFIIGINGKEKVILGNSVEKKPGYIFGNKSEWNVEEYTPCEECNDHGVCKMNQNSPNDICKNSGCPLPEKKEKTTVLGNMYSVGNRIAYKCNGSYEGNSTETPTSVCLKNGEWSQGSVTCISAEEAIPYQAVWTKLTWDEAKKNCETLGGYLSDVKTEREQKIIEGLVSGFRHKVRIGGTNTLEDEYTFIWLDNTTVSSGFVNWEPGQPSYQGGGIQCIRIEPLLNFKWKDWNCDREAVSVCKFK